MGTEAPKPEAPKPGTLVTLANACRLLGVTRVTLRLWCLRGKVRRVERNGYPFVVWPEHPPIKKFTGKKSNEAHP